jgi:hypothetical protein
MKPGHYKGLCKICKRAKEAENHEKWTCKTWEECKSHPPLPTAGNFDLFEIWEDVVGCVKSSGMGPSGFDILAVKEVVLLAGMEWTSNMFKRVKILERVYLEEVGSGK